MKNADPAAQPAPSAQYLFWWGLILLVVGVLIGAGLMELLRPSTGPAGVGVRQRDPNEPFPVLGRVSDFALTERNGDTYTRDDLEGRVWVADFFFTSCATICPMMSGAMSRLQHVLADTDEVTLVSISVDPERDTPKRLRWYAQRYEADPVRWWFLTGERNVIYKLANESFRLSVEEIPEEDRQPDMDRVLHSSKFILLDRSSRIRGYYDGEDPDTVNQLAADVRALLKE